MLSISSKPYFSPLVSADRIKNSLLPTEPPWGPVYHTTYVCPRLGPTDAKFETRNEQYRIIGTAGIAYGEYALSVDYNNQGRQVVHEGRYTMTYTKVGDAWQIVMQHNTPAGECQHNLEMSVSVQSRNVGLTASRD